MKYLNSTEYHSHLLIQFLGLYWGTIQKKDLFSLFDSQYFNVVDLLKLIQMHKCNEIVLYTIHKHQLGINFPILMRRLFAKVAHKQKHNNELAKEFSQFANQLTSEGINYAVYKGMVFAEIFYPASSLRSYVDIDLGLALKDIPRAAQILFDIGYEQHKGLVDYENLSESRAYQIDFSFVKRDKEGNILYNIELHWQAAHNVLKIPYQFGNKLDQIIDMNINKYNVKTLNNIEQAIIMIIHHGMVDVWGKLRHLIDLHFVLKTLTEEEMRLLRVRLKELKLTKCFELGCQQLEILKQERAPNQFWELIISGNMSKNWSEFKPKLIWHLKMRESFLERLKVLISLTLFKLRFKKHKDKSPII